MRMRTLSRISFRRNFMTKTAALSFLLCFSFVSQAEFTSPCTNKDKITVLDFIQEYRKHAELPQPETFEFLECYPGSKEGYPFMIIQAILTTNKDQIKDGSAFNILALYLGNNLKWERQGGLHISNRKFECGPTLASNDEWSVPKLGMTCDQSLEKFKRAYSDWCPEGLIFVEFEIQHQFGHKNFFHSCLRHLNADKSIEFSTGVHTCREGEYSRIMGHGYGTDPVCD